MLKTNMIEAIDRIIIDFPLEQQREVLNFVEFLQSKLSGPAKINSTKRLKSIDPDLAIQQLYELGKNLPPVDAVAIVRQSREDLQNRGVF